MVVVVVVLSFSGFVSFVCIFLFIWVFINFLHKELERKDEDFHRKSNSKVVPQNKGSSVLLNKKTVDYVCFCLILIFSQYHWDVYASSCLGTISVLKQKLWGPKGVDFQWDNCNPLGDQRISKAPGVQDLSDGCTFWFSSNVPEVELAQKPPHFQIKFSFTFLTYNFQR